MLLAEILSGLSELPLVLQVGGVLANDLDVPTGTRREVTNDTVFLPPSRFNVESHLHGVSYIQLHEGVDTVVQELDHDVMIPPPVVPRE